jgi:hypothetical protein
MSFVPEHVQAMTLDPDMFRGFKGLECQYGAIYAANGGKAAPVFRYMYGARQSVHAP